MSTAATYDLTPSAPQPWSVKQVVRSIRFQTSDRDLLASTWEGLRAYAKNVADIALPERIQLKADLQGRDFIELSDALPVSLRAWFGEYPAEGGIPANGHGAALVAAGVFPGMTRLDSPLDLPGDLLEEIEADNRTSGDLLHFEGEHSCVLLGRMLCFSMDSGRFTVRNLEDVMQEHKGATLRYYRKKGPQTIPENFHKVFGQKEEVARVEAIYRKFADSQPSLQEAWIAAADNLKS